MLPRPVLLAGVALAALVAAGAPARAQDSLEVVVSRAGFRPKLVNLRKGETTRLLLKTADEEHCFAIDAFRVEKRVVPGKATSLDLTPDKAGSFPFHCCLEPQNETLRGRVVVAE